MLIYAMQLYRSSLSSLNPDGVLSHFGTMCSAVHRLDSMFNTTYRYGLNRKGIFDVYDTFGRFIKTETPQQSLVSFSEFLKLATISSYDVNISKPLRLTDCWQDDPIGSGAMDIFVNNKDLGQKQIKELSSIFHPFKTTIYPHDVAMNIRREEIDALRLQSFKNDVFHKEIEKRKSRSKSINEPWSFAEPHELIWVDRTLQLRRWALENSYDSFVYTNDGEDKGNDSYITLNGRDIIQKEQTFGFDQDLYLKTVSLPVYANFMLDQIKIADGKPVIGTFWAGYEPTLFWSEIKPS